ncbi:MAG TPA: flagellar basal-body MS-ring/collar protein FliF [Kineosporiaceae bacterium]
MNQLAARGRQLLAGFTPGQRGIILVAVLALALGTVVLGRWAAQPSWSPLFTGLSASDTSAIIDQLKGQNVPYQLANAGNTIMVPQERVYDLRVAMAAKGLTNTSEGSGYSVLDKQGMTATDFQQNVAYQRALESELNRTLQAIGGVKTAIVHLAIPKKDVFTTDAEHPTASVLLALAPGTALSRSQIRSVMRLVAGSVPGLNPSDVTVSDADGNLLSVREDGVAGAVSAASEADQQTQAFEDAKSMALQKMLDGVLGAGKAIVRVNAELNFDSRETTSHSYLSQTGIPPLVQATSSESYGGSPGAGGALGQTYPSLTAAGGGGGGTYVHVNQTVNNAVGDVTSHTTAAPGSPKRLTVAVAIDSKANVDTQTITNLVSTAVGIDTTRGDSVQVNRIAFDTTAMAAAAKELKDAQAAAKTAAYIDLGKKAGLVLAALIALLIWRRRSRRATPRQLEAVASDLPPVHHGPVLLDTMGEQLAISAGARELSATDEALDSSLERQLLRDEVGKFVDQQPEEIALIVQSWLGQRKN